MRDDERAEKLARAIEEMVQGRAPEDLDDEELQELLQIAKIRLDVAKLAAKAGTEAQNDVLKRVIARLDALQKSPGGKPNGVPTASESVAPAQHNGEHFDVRELEDVIGLRHSMARHAAHISERHREAVWQRVQARIQAAQAEKPGFFRWPFRRRDREVDALGAALDRMILGEPMWEAAGSRLEALLGVAQLRREAAAEADFQDQQARVWSRLRPRIMAKTTPRRTADRHEGRSPSPWPKLAAAGAAVALVVAALGPIPATGLANHPLTELVRFVGGHVGVSETSAPPQVPPVTEVIESSDVTAAEAGALLGLAVREPTFVPAGYDLASSRYFPQGITASEGGVFVLAYEAPTGSGGAILLYQERVSASTISVERGSARDISLPDTGTDATYVSGSWRFSGSDLTWGDDGAQTLIFDAARVRTIIHTGDGAVAIADLVAMADSLAGQSAPPN